MIKRPQDTGAKGVQRVQKSLNPELDADRTAENYLWWINFLQNPNLYYSTNLYNKSRNNPTDGNVMYRSQNLEKGYYPYARADHTLDLMSGKSVIARGLEDFIPNYQDLSPQELDKALKRLENQYWVEESEFERDDERWLPPIVRNRYGAQILMKDGMPIELTPKITEHVRRLNDARAVRPTDMDEETLAKVLAANGWEVGQQIDEYGRKFGPEYVYVKGGPRLLYSYDGGEERGGYSYKQNPDSKTISGPITRANPAAIEHETLPHLSAFYEVPQRIPDYLYERYDKGYRKKSNALRAAHGAMLGAWKDEETGTRLNLPQTNVHRLLGEDVAQKIIKDMGNYLSGNTRATIINPKNPNKKAPVAIGPLEAFRMALDDFSKNTLYPKEYRKDVLNMIGMNQRVSNTLLRKGASKALNLLHERGVDAKLLRDIGNRYGRNILPYIKTDAPFDRTFDYHESFNAPTRTAPRRPPEKKALMKDDFRDYETWKNIVRELSKNEILPKHLMAPELDKETVESLLENGYLPEMEPEELARLSDEDARWLAMNTFWNEYDWDELEKHMDEKGYDWDKLRIESPEYQNVADLVDYLGETFNEGAKTYGPYDKSAPERALANEPDESFNARVDEYNKKRAEHDDMVRNENAYTTKGLDAIKAMLGTIPEEYFTEGGGNKFIKEKGGEDISALLRDLDNISLPGPLNEGDDPTKVTPYANYLGKGKEKRENVKRLKQENKDLWDKSRFGSASIATEVLKDYFRPDNVGKEFYNTDTEEMDPSEIGRTYLDTAMRAKDSLRRPEKSSKPGDSKRPWNLWDSWTLSDWKNPVVGSAYKDDEVWERADKGLTRRWRKDARAAYKKLKDKIRATSLFPGGQRGMGMQPDNNGGAMLVEPHKRVGPKAPTVMDARRNNLVATKRFKSESGGQTQKVNDLLAAAKERNPGEEIGVDSIVAVPESETRKKLGMRAYEDYVPPISGGADMTENVTATDTPPTTNVETKTEDSTSLGKSMGFAQMLKSATEERWMEKGLPAGYAGKTLPAYYRTVTMGCGKDAIKTRDPEVVKPSASNEAEPVKGIGPKMTRKGDA